MELKGSSRHLTPVCNPIHCLAGLFLASILQPLCSAQSPNSSAIPADGKPRVVTVGTHLRLPLPREVKRLAVGDENVLSVELLNTREALVLGKSLGTTTVLAWYADGSHEPLLMRVQRDLSLLQTAIESICPTAKVQMAPDRDAVVVTGAVPTETVRKAILTTVDSYLMARPRSDMTFSSKLDESGNPQEVNLQVDGGQLTKSAIVDLMIVTEAASTMEARILDAIRPIAGEDVGVRRLQRSPLTDDQEDVLVLEGTVPDQIALVRAMQLAAQMFLGNASNSPQGGNTIQVLADEAGALINGSGQSSQGGQGQSGGGGRFAGGGGGQSGGFAGGGGVSVQRNEVRRNLGRATVLSMARGRILSFVEVRDRPQVRVAVQLFEIDRDQLFQFSSEIQALVSDFNQPILDPSIVGNNIQPIPANVGAFSDSDVQAGLASLTNGFSQQIQVSGRRFALDTLLQALEARGIARRLSSPVLTVLNGETAQFQVGGEIPVPQSFTPAAGGGNGLGTFSSVDFRQFGVGLGIRPLVGKGGDVTLDLSSIVSQPDQTLTTIVRDSTGTDPQTTAFATRSLNTNARLQDGQSLLVGGLVSRNLRDDVSKTPLLGDLPLLGWLFRTKNTNFSKSELFILVSPSVVRPPVEGSELWLQPSLGETLAACRSEIEASKEPNEEPNDGTQPKPLP